MAKIIKKENIDIEELKILKDNNEHIVLLGDFSEEEKQDYYALGIYDIVSTLEDAEWKASDATLYNEISINNEDVIKEKTVNKDINISKPGIFTNPLKTVIAGVSAVAIVGASLAAFGLTTDIVKVDEYDGVSQKIMLPPEEIKEFKNSQETSVLVEEIKNIVEDNKETYTPNSEQKELGGSISTPQFTIETKQDESEKLAQESQTIIIPAEDVTGTIEGEANIEDNPLLEKEETSLGDRVVSKPAPADSKSDNTSTEAEKPDDGGVSKPAETPRPSPAPEQPVEIDKEVSNDDASTDNASDPEFVIDENGDYTIVW